MDALGNFGVGCDGLSTFGLRVALKKIGIRFVFGEFGCRFCATFLRLAGWRIIILFKELSILPAKLVFPFQQSEQPKLVSPLTRSLQSSYSLPPEPSRLLFTLSAFILQSASAPSVSSPLSVSLPPISCLSRCGTSQKQGLLP